MSLFQMKWLRKFVRKNTRPIEQRSAMAWRDRLSIVYAILAWNAFGAVCYMAFTGRIDWAKHHGLKSEEELKMSSSEQFARLLKIEKAKVIQIKGLKKVNEFEIGAEPAAAAAASE